MTWIGLVLVAELGSQIRIAWLGRHPSIHPSYFLASFLLQKQYETVFMSIFLFPNEIQWYRRASGPTRRGCSSQILQSAWKFSATWVCSKVLYIYIYTLYSTTFFFERLPQAKKLRRTGAFVTYQFRCRMVTPTILDVSDLASSINLSFRARRMVFISSSIASILPPEWFCLGHHVASVRLPATCSCSRITSTRKWTLQISLRCHWANNCRCSRELQSGLPKQHTTRLSLHEHTHGSDALCTSCDFTYEFFRVWWWCHMPYYSCMTTRVLPIIWMNVTSNHVCNHNLTQHSDITCAGILPPTQIRLQLFDANNPRFCFVSTNKSCCEGINKTLTNKEKPSSVNLAQSTWPKHMVVSSHLTVWKLKEWENMRSRQA